MTTLLVVANGPTPADAALAETLRSAGYTLVVRAEEDVAPSDAGFVKLSDLFAVAAMFLGILAAGAVVWAAPTAFGYLILALADQPANVVTAALAGMLVLGGIGYGLVVVVDAVRARRVRRAHS